MLETGNRLSFSCLRNVLRACKTGIHNAEPLFRPAFLYGENQILPVGIDQHVKVVVSESRPTQKVGESPRVPGKVHPRSCTIPLDIFTPVAAPPDGWMGFSERDHAFEKAKHVPIVLEKIPIQPG